MLALPSISGLVEFCLSLGFNILVCKMGSEVPLKSVEERIQLPSAGPGVW